MNLKSVNQIVALFLFTTILCFEKVSACFILKPDIIQDVKLVGLLDSNQDQYANITNIDEYTMVFPAFDECTDATYYLKSWVLYVVLAIAMSLVSAFLYRRMKVGQRRK